MEIRNKCSVTGQLADPRQDLPKIIQLHKFELLLTPTASIYAAASRGGDEGAALD